MIPEQSTQDNTLFKQLNLNNAMGYLLILSGLGAAFGVLLEIYALFVNPQELAVFRQLFPEQLTISWESGLVTVPAEILAYTLPLFLLSMAGGIASALINAGSNLLRSKR